MGSPGLKFQLTLTLESGSAFSCWSLTWQVKGSATPWSVEKHQSPGSFQENLITLNCLCTQQTNLVLLTVQAFLIFPDMELVVSRDDRAAPVLSSDTEVDASSFSVLFSMFPKIIIFFKICWWSARKWHKDGDGKSHQNIVATVKALGKLQVKQCGSGAPSVYTWASQARLTGIQLTKFNQFSQRHLTRCASLQGEQ